MTMSVCRECGQAVSTEADDCPHCGCENPVKKRGWGRIIAIAGGVVLILALAGNLLVPLAGCDVANIEITADTFLIDGSFDAGFALTADVVNSGDAAALFRVVATLSTSEGDFKRTQEIVLQPEVTRALQYGFHEPTVNAFTSQGRVACEAVRR